MSMLNNAERPEGKSNRDLFWWGSLVGLVLICMGSVLWCPFTGWDDPHTIWENKNFLPPSVESVMEYWDYRKPAAGLWVPMTYTIWGILAAFAYNPKSLGPRGEQISPFPFHAMSLLVHVVTVLLVFVIIRRLLKSRWGRESDDRQERNLFTAAAWMGAVVFGIHPIQVEAVAWTSGLKDLLWVLSATAAVYFWMRSSERGLYWKSRWWWGGYLIFMLGTVSKPTAMVIPALVFVVGWLGMGKRLGEVVKGVWPWFLWVPVVGLWTRQIQTGIGVQTLIWPLRPLIVTDAYAFYIWKTVWPVNLAFEYGRNPIYAMKQGWLWWTWIVPVTLAVAMWWWMRRDDGKGMGRLAIAGCLWAIVAVGPVCGIVPFMYQFYSTVADHYFHGAMVGVGLVVAAGLVELVRRGVERRLLAGIACIVIAVLGWRSFVQMSTWWTSVRFYEHSIAVNPKSFGSLSNLGTEYVVRTTRGNAGPENFAVGLRYAERAIEVNPSWSKAWDLKASCLIYMGRVDEAVPIAEKALELNMELPMGVRGDMSPGRLILGEVALRKGRYDEALRQFELGQAELRLFPKELQKLEPEVLEAAIERAKKAKATAATRASGEPTTLPAGK